MATPAVEDAGLAPIEIGSARADGTLRYWLAKEAVRQGELMLVVVFIGQVSAPLPSSGPAVSVSGLSELASGAVAAAATL